MTSKFLKATFASLILSASCFVNVANAGIIGGSDIIDQNDVATLGNWLGSNLELTNIFTKEDGMTSHHWHDAVDGKGATFTLIEATFNEVTYIFGGYNEASWNSSATYNQISYATDTSFLFSLTENVKLERDRNVYSTYSNTGYGATFGSGHDLHINTALSGGYSNLGYSYGDTSQYTTASRRTLLAGSSNGFVVEKYETFTVSASKVPGPSTLAIFALGIMGLGIRRRSNNQ